MSLSALQKQTKVPLQKTRVISEIISSTVTSTYVTRHTATQDTNSNDQQGKKKLAINSQNSKYGRVQYRL